MSVKEAARLEGIYTWLEASRKPFDMAIEDIQGLMLPHRMEINTQSMAGKQRIPASYDSTAANSADALVNFLSGAVLPSTSDWLKFDIFLGVAEGEVRERLDIGAEKVLQVMDNSNFYEAGGVSLKDLWVLGNTTWFQEEQLPSAAGALFGDDSGFTGFSFEGVQYANMYRHLDRQGNTLVSCRVFPLSQLEAQRFFGDKWKKTGNPGDPAIVKHFYEREVDGSWTESWLDCDLGRLVGDQRKNLTFNPYSSHRLDQVGNEQMGVGRGHIARPTAAGMNEMRRQMLNATGRSLNTPLVVENESVVRTERGTGGLIVMREAAAFQPFYLRADVDLAAVDNVFRADTTQVERAFMSDILLDPDSQPRSAEESRLRQARLQNRIAGPTQVVRRWLSAIVGNIVTGMVQVGALPEFEGLGAVQPVFSSPFFVAQRQGSIQKVIDFVQLKVALATAANDPKILDDIDWDGVSRFLERNADVPSTVFRDQQQVDAMRRARAETEGINQGLEQAALAASLVGQGQIPNPASATSPEGTVPVEGSI